MGAALPNRRRVIFGTQVLLQMERGRPNVIMMHPDAQLAVLNIIQMMFAIGVPLCMVAGWGEPKKRKINKKKAAAGKSARPTASRRTLKSVTQNRKTATKKPAAKTWYVAPPMSAEQQREYTRYKIGFDFPNFKAFSNMPL